MKKLYFLVIEQRTKYISFVFLNLSNKPKIEKIKRKNPAAIHKFGSSCSGESHVLKL